MDINLQLPINLHVKLKMAADIDGRSLEAEIVELLEQALRSWSTTSTTIRRRRISTTTSACPQGTFLSKRKSSHEQGHGWARFVTAPDGRAVWRPGRG